MTLNASGSRHSLALVPEVAYAVTPATPAFVPIRHNSTTLSLAKSSLQSAELRPDRQIAGYRTGTKSANGDIVSEITSGGSFDSLLALALMGEWNGDTLKAGLLRNTVSIERFFSDIGQYSRFRGCEVTKIAIAIKNGALATSTFSIWSNDADPMAQAAIVGSTYDAATTTQPMTGLEAAVKEGGAVLSLISDVAFTLDNGISPTYVVGQSNSLQPSVGKSNLTGTITAYFSDAVLYNKFVNETPTSLEFTLNDRAGNSYKFLLPNVHYTAAPLPVSGDGPITIAIPFQGLFDSTEASNITVTRIIAP
jgi:hypothetical protein